jgi:sodium/pantothenate symporter
MDSGSVILGWILVVIFIGIMIWIGKLGVEKSKDMAGFAIAKGQARPWMAGICFGATFASANLFMGVPGWAYTTGEPVLWWAADGNFGIWIAIILLAKKFWKFGQEAGGSITLADWFQIRYRSKFLSVGVALLSLLSVTYIAGQTVGMGTIFESILKIPYTWGVILGTLIVIIYIGMGGTYADIMTDVVQGIIMMIFGFTVFISLAWTIGGGLGFLGKLHNELRAISPNLVGVINPESSKFFPFKDVLGIVSIWLGFGFVLLPHLINKVLTLKDERELRQFLLWVGIAITFMSNTMVFAGLAGRVLIPNLKLADTVVPQYIFLAFPKYVDVFMIVVLLSAILSTTDGLFVSISTQLSNDVYRKFLAPIIHGDSEMARAKAERIALKLTRVLVVLIGIGAILLAVRRPKSLMVLSLIGNNGIISGVMAALILSYFWTRANRIGATVSFVVGVVGYSTLLLSGWEPNLFKASMISWIVAAVVMVIVSGLTAPDPEEHVRRFIPYRKTS